MKALYVDPDERAAFLEAVHARELWEETAIAVTARVRRWRSPANSRRRARSCSRVGRPHAGQNRAATDIGAPQLRQDDIRAAPTSEGGS